MAKEKSLDLAAVQTWLAAWKEKDLYSDAAVRDLLSLIPDNHCMVVITCGVGCPPRSLVFRRWRRGSPPANSDDTGRPRAPRCTRPRSTDDVPRPHPTHATEHPPAL